MTDTIAQRVQALGHSLPDAPGPAANYIPWVRSGNLVFISGQISQRDGQPAYLGRLGGAISVEDGKKAAELAALCVLAQAAAAVGGDASRVVRVVRLGVFVASEPDFSQQSVVANGASDLIVAVLGEAGRHTRAAVGVAALPRGAAVEIDAIVEIRD